MSHNNTSTTSADEPHHTIDIRPEPTRHVSAPTGYPPAHHLDYQDRFSSQSTLLEQQQSPSSPVSDRKSRIYYKTSDEEKSRHSSRWSLNYDQIAAGAQEFLSAGERFDTRNASEAHLTFAEGDFVKTRTGRIYAYFLNVSIVTRWILYIVPVAALLWIPGILGCTVLKTATIYQVRLVRWSIWMSAAWVGWWAALAFGMIIPKVLRWTIGFAAVSTRNFIGWIENMRRPLAFVAWSVGCWISFQPLVKNQLSNEAAAVHTGSAAVLLFIYQFLLGLVLCAVTLCGEKLAIQFIANNFHERSYAERISRQQIRMNILINLYANSSDIHGRADTLKDVKAPRKSSTSSSQFIKDMLEGAREVAEGATTALGNIASEILGSSTLQPTSPEAKVYTALSSAKKSHQLARRLFYSFRKEGSSALVLDDIAKFFPDIGQARVAFSMFDKDGNGDVSRDEVEITCLDLHHELLSLSSSMKDIDSAVRRLDNVLMSLYFIVALLIMAVCLDASVKSLLTGAGASILGLSWLIGGSAQEILTSIIFLFVKHPYDVGDTVQIDADTYTVKEMRLLSTIFLDSSGVSTQAPHSALTSRFIKNHRRSGPEAESFQFDVSFDTTFEQIEELRAKMLAFVESRRRDFQPTFNVSVKDIPDQKKLTLVTRIQFKSNNHVAALKARRRNMWVCAFKNSLQDLEIYGPGGGPKPERPTQYTLVPWEIADPDNKPKKPKEEVPRKIKEHTIPRADYDLAERDVELQDNVDDVFGDTADLDLTSPRQRRRPTAPRRENVAMGQTSSKSNTSG